MFMQPAKQVFDIARSVLSVNVIRIFFITKNRKDDVANFVHDCSKSNHLWLLPRFLYVVFTKIWVNALTISLCTNGCQCYSKNSTAGDSGASLAVFMRSDQLMNPLHDGIQGIIELFNHGLFMATKYFIRGTILAKNHSRSLASDITQMCTDVSWMDSLNDGAIVMGTENGSMFQGEVCLKTDEHGALKATNPEE